MKKTLFLFILVFLFFANIINAQVIIDDSTKLNEKIQIARWNYDTQKYDLNDFELKFGESEVLCVVDENGKDISDLAITWSSSNKKIVKLVAEANSAVGVAAVGIGTTTIKASLSNGVSDTIKITVTNKNINKIKIARYNLGKYDYNDFKFELGNCDLLFALDENKNPIVGIITWSSSDKKIVTVNERGEIKAVGTGTAIITAKYGNVKDTIKITVIQPVKNIKLDKISMSLTKGKSATLKATVTPNNAYLKTVSWKSSNKKVATVDSQGVVKAVGVGTATITATTNGTDEYGDKLTATCKVTVKDSAVKVTGVKLDKTSLSLAKGKTATLKATVSPSNATDKTVTWKSSNTKIATVSSSGVVKGIAKGTATITVTTTYGKKTATCKVTVTNIEKIKLGRYNDDTGKDDYNDFKLKLGESEAVYVFDENGKEISSKSITWSSSNKKIVGISDRGNYAKIVAYGIGEATIKATLSNGASDTIKVIVPNVKKIKIGRYIDNTGKYDYNDFKIKLGESVYFKILDENGKVIENRGATWSSSDEKFVKFDELSCVFVAVGVGKATIKATLSNGVSDTITITVINNTGKIKIGRYNDDTGKDDYNDFKLKLGKYEYLDVFDENGKEISNELITWSSSNKKIVTVDSNGFVVAVGVGKATITAKLPNGVSDTIKITVTSNINKINIAWYSNDKYDYDYNDFKLKLGKSEYLDVLDENKEEISSGAVTWSSSDEKIVKVIEHGWVVAVGVGTATIKASLSTGVSDTIKITVTNRNINKINIARYNYDTNKYDYNDFKLKLGEGNYLYALDENKNPIFCVITWSSSDKKIVTVDELGVIKAVGTGTATITAKYGNVKDTIKITVYK